MVLTVHDLDDKFMDLEAYHVNLLADIVGSMERSKESLVYDYSYSRSGFSALLTDAEAEALAGAPSVLFVEPSKYYEIATTHSSDFLGLELGNLNGLYEQAAGGEGIVVGVIDSGIWPESRSFSDQGYSPVPSSFRGICQAGAPGQIFTCNRKIVGARYYARQIPSVYLSGEHMSARDYSGHGTHVSSIVAGNIIRGVNFQGFAAGVARGLAPRARISTYKACWGRGQTALCGSHAVMAAMNDAVKDGVDVMSISIGGSHEFAKPYGIPVVLAAGNSGPSSYSVGNDSPWVITVGAGSMNRSFPTKIIHGNGEVLVGQSLYTGAAGPSSNGDELVFGYSCDAQTLSQINATDKVVLCTLPRQADPTKPNITTIVSNLVSLGAKGLIYGQNSGNIIETTSDQNISAVILVDYETAHRIASYATNGRDPKVQIMPATTVVGSDLLVPRVAAFSSRGPSASSPSILKPDVIAPGVAILGAYQDTYKFMSGTSMACPHVAGVVPLLGKVHPSWSPAMIYSAIITTANTSDSLGRPIGAEGPPRKSADPFDFGGGHINPERAADPGLVFDVDSSEYLPFIHSRAGFYVEPKDAVKVNLPSITLPYMKDSFKVQRTVTNVGPEEAEYHALIEAPPGCSISVQPSILKFAKGGQNKATYEVTLERNDKAQDTFTFGSLTWDDGIHQVRTTIAVRFFCEDLGNDAS